MSDILTDKLFDLYAYLKENADEIKWGIGTRNGSFAPLIYRLSKSVSPIFVFSDGTLIFKLSWLFN